jgi:hypothetical protein
MKEMVMKEDITILSFLGHTHARGKSFTLEIERPGERPENICRRQKFGISTLATLDDPVFAPKGTKVRGIFVFDNSKQNPLNPDPSKQVQLGFFWTDEMAVVDLMYVKGKL